MWVFQWVTRTAEKKVVMMVWRSVLNWVLGMVEHWGQMSVSMKVFVTVQMMVSELVLLWVSQWV